VAGIIVRAELRMLRVLVILHDAGRPSSHYKMIYHIFLHATKWVANAVQGAPTVLPIIYLLECTEQLDPQWKRFTSVRRSCRSYGSAREDGILNSFRKQSR
jgi:hypothetical protein